MESETEFYLVTKDGEIIDTLDGHKGQRVAVLDCRDRIIKYNTQELINNSVVIKYNFLKVNQDVWDRVVSKYPILSSLVCYIGYLDNVLIYPNGKCIRYKDISKITGVSESTVKRQMKGMLEEDIVHKIEIDKKNYIVVNPFICMKGKRIIKRIYDEFKQSIWNDNYDVYKGYK